MHCFKLSRATGSAITNVRLLVYYKFKKGKLDKKIIKIKHSMKKDKKYTLAEYSFDSLFFSAIVSASKTPSFSSHLS
jgi:hypothetical protein